MGVDRNEIRGHLYYNTDGTHDYEIYYINNELFISLVHFGQSYWHYPLPSFLVKE